MVIKLYDTSISFIIASTGLLCSGIHRQLTIKQAAISSVLLFFYKHSASYSETLCFGIAKIVL